MPDPQQPGDDGVPAGAEAEAMDVLPCNAARVACYGNECSGSRSSRHLPPPTSLPSSHSRSASEIEVGRGSRRSKSSNRKDAPCRGVPPTVLVVDDEADLCRLLERVLNSAGYQVLTAASGVGLTALVQQRQPQVVVLDQVMQPVSGLEALHALRASGQLVPVLMLTALGGDDLVQTALDAGADDYLTKPFSVTVLLARIRMLLRRTRW